MAELVGSVIGTAIGGPIGGFIGGQLGRLVDNVLMPTNGPRMSGLTINQAAYGATIPKVYGPENRVGASLIWMSALKEHKHKNIKSGQTTYTYTVDLAWLLAGNECDSLRKIWANSTVIFDASAATSTPTPGVHGDVTWTTANAALKSVASITFYRGNRTQTADPTMEAALGVGNVPGYRGSCYGVLKDLNISDFNGAIPTLNFLLRQRTAITLAEVVADIVTTCGLDLNTVSTSALGQSVRGYIVGDMNSGAQALQPLGLAFDFDGAEVAGGLRFSMRGQAPQATILLDWLNGHEGGALANGKGQPYSITRTPTTLLPNAASITFFDPARDYQTNTQGDTRSHGYSQNVLTTTLGMTLTADDAKKIADRALWEPFVASEGFQAATDDRLQWLEPGKTFAVEGPSGTETIRLKTRARGANRIIQFDAVKERVNTYTSTTPGSAAPITPNVLQLESPVNPPIIFEGPPELSNGVPQLWFAISEGDGTTANPYWRPKSIYLSTDDADFHLIGQTSAPSTQGKLTAILAAYASANPDTINTAAVSTVLSGQDLTSGSAADAARYTPLVYVGGEFMSYQDATATGTHLFDLGTRLYRGLYRTSPGAHAIGSAFCLIDSTIFRYDLPAAYVGVPLYFRFVGNNEDLSTATSYPHTPSGSASSVGPATSVVATTTGSTIAITWTASPGPFLAGYEIRASTDGGATYTPIGTAGPTATSFDFTATLPSTTYKFAVVALSSAPMVSSSTPALSGSATSTTAGARIWAPTISLFGRKPDANEVLAQSPITFAVRFPAGFSGSSGRCDVAPTGNRVFRVQRNGVQIGTVTFPAGLSGDDCAVFAEATSPGGDMLFAPPNDDFEFLAPTSTDSTFEGFSVQFLGSID